MRGNAMVKCLKADLSAYLPKTFCEDSFSTAQADAESWSSQEVAAGLLLTGVLKKYAPKGQSPEAVLKTLKKFEDLNTSLVFDLPNPGDSESTTYLLSLFKDEMWKVLDWEIDGRNLDLEFIRDHFAAGPGASRMANSRNFYTKMFDSNHSHTSAYVLALFRAAISESETWVNALEHWSKTFEPKMVSGNTLFTVKKNSEISRTCCTEPLINMLMQKATGSFIEYRCKRSLGIDLASQPDVNRMMARIGAETGSYGTTDLSSASDSIAVTLCEWACPPTFFKWLKHFRSETTRFPNGQEKELRMISTMGNGFTFPLETVIFACAVRAVYQSKGLSAHFVGGNRNAAVFGDDIIVRKDCFDTVNQFLRRLGFTVNESKSFNTGSFRESCGFDYYGCTNVRPVFVESLETPQDVYSSFNRLSRWSAEHRVPLGRTLIYLSKLARFLPIPFSWADDSGFKVPRLHAPKTYGPDFWHRFKFLKPLSTIQPVPVGKVDAQNLNYKDFNPWGWELCFIGGYARNPGGTFLTCADPEKVNTRRDDGINRRPYQGEVLPRRLRTGTIPYWDWFGAEDTGRFGRCSFKYWEVLVAQIF